MPAKLFDCTIADFETNVALGGQRGSLSVRLVEDLLDGDAFNPPDPGDAVYFSFGSLEFNGLLQSIATSIDAQGAPVYQVVINDASDILSAAPVILNGYAGASPVPNVINLYGYYENTGFGNSLATAQGMPWVKVGPGLDAIINGTATPYGGPIAYRGVSYGLDITGLPAIPDDYRVGGQHTVLSLIDTVCRDFGLDYFVRLDGFVVVVHVVDRTTQPALGALSTLLSSVTFTGIVPSSQIGVEARNEVTTKVLVGGYQNTLYVSDEIYSYWGDDAAGAPIVGTAIAHPDLPGEPCEEVTVPLTIQLASFLGSATYTTNTIEMRCALRGRASWENYLANFKPATHAFTLGIYKTQAGNKAKPDVIVDDPANVLAMLDEAVEADTTALYSLVRAFADQYYGKSFLAKVPDVLVKLPATGDDRLVFSHDVDSAGWLPDAAAIGLDDVQRQSFESDDGRVLPFAVIPDPALLDTSAFNIDQYVTNATTDLLYARARVGDRLLVIDGAAYARFTLEIPPAFLYEELDGGAISAEIRGWDAADRAQEKKTGAFGVIEHEAWPRAVYPTYAGIPLTSAVATYGPWTAAGAEGKVDYEQDTSLVPWTYGSVAAMEAAAAAKVAAAGVNQIISESGQFTAVGVPLASPGDILAAGCPPLVGIQVRYGSQGLTTTYQFNTYTEGYRGEYHRQQDEQFRQAASQQVGWRRQAVEALGKRTVALATAAAARDTALALMGPRAARKAKKKETPHECFVVQSFTDGDDTRVGAATVTTEEGLFHSRPDDGAVYRNTALAHVSALVRGYTAAPTGTRPTGTVLPGYRWRGTGDVGAGNTEAVRSDGLFPHGGDDVEILNWGGTYDGIKARARGATGDTVRSVALRGPLVVEGWGRGTDGKYYPGDSSGGGATGDYVANYKRRSDLWPVGPVDHLWDPNRGVWTSHDLVAGYPSGAIPATGSGTLYVGDLGATQWPLTVYNPSTSTVPTGDRVTAGYVVNKNRWELFGGATAPATTPTGGTPGWPVRVTSVAGTIVGWQRLKHNSGTWSDDTTSPATGLAAAVDFANGVNYLPVVGDRGVVSSLPGSTPAYLFENEQADAGQTRRGFVNATTQDWGGAKRLFGNWTVTGWTDRSVLAVTIDSSPPGGGSIVLGNPLDPVNPTLDTVTAELTGKLKVRCAPQSLGDAPEIEFVAISSASLATTSYTILPTSFTQTATDDYFGTIRTRSVVLGTTGGNTTVYGAVSVDTIVQSGGGIYRYLASTELTKDGAYIAEFWGDPNPAWAVDDPGILVAWAELSPFVVFYDFYHAPSGDEFSRYLRGDVIATRATSGSAEFTGRFGVADENLNVYYGITTTQTFKDGSGVTKTMTIQGGLITGIS